MNIKKFLLAMVSIFILTSCSLGSKISINDFNVIYSSPLGSIKNDLAFKEIPFKSKVFSSKEEFESFYEEYFHKRAIYLDKIEEIRDDENIIFFQLEADIKDNIIEHYEVSKVDLKGATLNIYMKNGESVPVDYLDVSHKENTTFKSIYILEINKAHFENNISINVIKD